MRNNLLLIALKEAFERNAARPAIVLPLNPSAPPLAFDYPSRYNSPTDAPLVLGYEKVESQAGRGAGVLQQYGVRKGDRVALCMPSKLKFLFAHLSALYAGAVALPLNPRITREELRFFLADSGARFVVASNELCAVVESLRPQLPQLHMVIPEDAVFDRVSVPYSLLDVTAADPCLLMYSSGTTGWPKGIVHTQGNVLSALRALQACWRLTPDDVVLNVLPLFHIHGLCFATLLTLLTGGTLILDDFEPQRTLQQIGDCSVFMAVPTIYYRFLEQPNVRDIAKTWQKPRLFTCGSAPIRAEVLPELQSILGKPVINRYGMTEAFVITSLPLDGPWPNGSVG